MGPSAHHSVMIVEDDDQTRDHFREKVCECPGLRVSAMAGTCSDAIRLLNTAPPDVLLVDLGLPDGDGVDVISHATGLSPEPAIMVITVFGDEQRVMRAIRAGASGYLLKTDTSSDICSCVQDLLNGGAPISPVIARYLIRHFHDGADGASADGGDLSARELDVLRLAAKGYTYQEVADLLGLSVNTVGTHTRSVYRKLAVSSRSEAVFEAARRGLVDVLGRSR